jgi:hypothetical protein
MASRRALPVSLILVLPALLALLSPAQAAGGSTCETAEVVPASATRAGYASFGSNNWFRHVATGPASWTLTNTGTNGATVHIQVFTDDCQTSLCYDSDYPATCSAPAGGYNFRVNVLAPWSSYSYSVTFSGQPAAPCHDAVDNDVDGNVDYPDDPGCTDPTDTTEGPTCPPVQGILVCLEPSTAVASLFVAATAPSADVAGYVDTYRVPLPGGVVTTIPCVVLKEGTTFVNPCATLGGTFLSRQAVLLAADLDGTSDGLVSVCKAELTAKAFGLGIDSAPAYAIC